MSERIILARFLSADSKPIEGLYIELNVHKRKWLLSCSYNPNKSNIMNHLKIFRFTFIRLWTLSMQSFLELCGHTILISEPPCHKNPERFSSIDLILTNSSSIFKNSFSMETCLSDFHKMTITVIKTTFQKLKPKLIYCQDYSMFSNDKFGEESSYNLSVENISNTSNDL